MGEETCRTLLLMDVELKTVREALQRATMTMDKRLLHSEQEQGYRGFF